MKRHRIIVAGGRNFDNYERLEYALLETIKGLNKSDIEIVSGECNTGVVTHVRMGGKMICGADGLGERFASIHGLPVKPMPADWANNGRAAGPIRNKQMAEYGTRLVCFWDDKSKGTKDMIKCAEKACIPVDVIYY